MRQRLSALRKQGLRFIISWFPKPAPIHYETDRTSKKRRKQAGVETDGAAGERSLPNIRGAAEK
jgi:hypothetical protein